MWRSAVIGGMVSVLLFIASVATAQKRTEEYLVQLSHGFNANATTKSLGRLEAAGFKDIRVLSAPTAKGRVYRVVTRPVPSLGEARLLATEAKRIARAKKVKIETTILRAADAGKPLVR